MNCGQCEHMRFTPLGDAYCSICNTDLEFDTPIECDDYKDVEE